MNESLERKPKKGARNVRFGSKGLIERIFTFNTAEDELKDIKLFYTSSRERDGQARQMIIDNLFSVTNSIL